MSHVMCRMGVASDFILIAIKPALPSIAQEWALQDGIQARCSMFSRCRRHHLWWVSSFPMPSIPSLHVLFLSSEERPGHHLKLYQYYSSDIHNVVQDVVQRQLRVSICTTAYFYAPADFHPKHDCEKDTQGPLNFSGNILAKMDDIGGGDDDDDDDVPVRPKRRNDGKLKPPGDMSLDTSDVSPHSLPPLTLHSWRISA